MKIIKILLILGVSLALFSCDRELPYDLDKVTKGVVIDVKKKFATDEILTPGSVAGEFIVNVSVPIEQKGYSNLDKVQLMCRYTPASGVSQYIMVKDDITEFPTEFVVNFAEICTALGVATPALNDRFSFVPDVYLKNGMLIPGWNEYSGGYPNNEFLGWRTLEKRGGETITRPYSYIASYVALVSLDMSKFQGAAVTTKEGGRWIANYTASVTPLDPTDMPDQKIMDEFGVTADILKGLLITGIPKAALDQGYPAEFKIWVNTRNHELIIPDQILAEDFDMPADEDGDGAGVGILELVSTTGSVNTAESSISFKGIMFSENGGWYYNFKLTF